MSAVTSYTQRFLAGEYEAVWTELATLPTVPGPLVDDVRGVARETMLRVNRHVRRLVEALTELDFVPDMPMHEPATQADRADVDRLDEEIGGLPIALTACLREVGAVSFLGDCPGLEVYYNTSGDATIEMPPGLGYPDPLCVPPVSYLREQWDEHRDEYEGEDEFVFDFAPDEFHKANISGGTHDIALPDPSPDPVLYGVAGRPGITLVQYLRVSIAWGGFPGWSFVPQRAPAALAALRVNPDF
jgi:hypothetical protein